MKFRMRRILSMDGDRVIASTLCDQVCKNYVQIQVGTTVQGTSANYDRRIDVIIVWGTCTTLYDLQCHTPYTKYVVLVRFTKLRQYGLKCTSPSASTGYHSYFESIVRASKLICIQDNKAFNINNFPQALKVQ